MAIALHHDEAIDTMIFRVTEVVGASDLVALLPRFLSHAKFRANMHQLLDLSGGGLDVSGEDLRDVLQAWLAKREQLGASYCIAVATTRPVDFGQARMAGPLIEQQPCDFRVFVGLEPARDWLREVNQAPGF